MKTNHRLYPFFALIAVLFFVVGCDQENPVSTFGEAVERVPELQLIDGADNATMHVQYDKGFSYFKVTLSNTGNSNLIADGTYYAWCLQMELPLETDREYSGVRLYSGDRDKTINKLNYIINNRSVYERANPALSWKDIQVAFWTILETKDMRLAGIADILPSSVEGYNATIVNNILSDVRLNGENFVPGFGDLKLTVTNAGEGEQSTGFHAETAWGGDTEGDGPAWWYYFDTAGPATQGIYAGQKLVPGASVTFNGTQLIIDLGPNMILQGGSETVKIQGYAYDDVPNFRPALGAMNRFYAGTDLVIDVPEFDVYAIHLDVLVNW